MASFCIPPFILPLSLTIRNSSPINLPVTQHYINKDHWVHKRNKSVVMKKLVYIKIVCVRQLMSEYHCINVVLCGIWQVRARSSAGFGDRATHASFMTASEIPSEPNLVTSQASQSAQCLVITWRPPQQPNGIIQSYNVSVPNMSSAKLNKSSSNPTWDTCFIEMISNPL